MLDSRLRGVGAARLGLALAGVLSERVSVYPSPLVLVLSLRVFRWLVMVSLSVSNQLKVLEWLSIAIINLHFDLSRAIGCNEFARVNIMEKRRIPVFA